MEKTKYTHLNEYLHEAKESQPIAALQEIELLLKQESSTVPEKIKPGSKFNLKYLIIMTSTVLITLALISQLSMQNPKQKTSPPLREPVSMKEQEITIQKPLANKPIESGSKSILTGNIKDEPLTNPDKNSATKGEDPIPNQISRLKILELSIEELAKLDINISTKGIFYENVIPYTKLAPRKTRLYYYNNKGYGISVKSPYISTGQGHDFYPVFISETNGNQQLKYDFESGKENPDKWSDSFFLATIPTLVPVLVKQSDYNFTNKKDLIFWFNVSPSFFDALPARIADDMRKEYTELTQSHNTAGITTNNAPAKCQYFDACQASLERFMKLNIYPNPAKDKLNLDFQLPEGNTATIYMTDIEGKIINDVPSAAITQHDQHAALNTSALKAGIYLLSIKLSTGNIISKRVIILGGQ